jgi:hypothetical protein
MRTDYLETGLNCILLCTIVKFVSISSASWIFLVCLRISVFSQLHLPSHQTFNSRIMDQLLKLATDSGMTKEQGETATGGIFSMVKKTLESGHFDSITEKFPEIKGLVGKYEDDTRAAGESSGSGGGLASSIMSSLGGSGGIAGLMAQLSSKGVDASQVSKFLPEITSFVQKNCGVDIGSVLGGASADSGTAPAAEGASGGMDVGGMVGKLGGMFGK